VHPEEECERCSGRDNKINSDWPREEDMERKREQRGVMLVQEFSRLAALGVFFS
jgi:hypothetical protein